MNYQPGQLFTFFKKDWCWKQADGPFVSICSEKGSNKQHIPQGSYLPSDMAGIILSHEPEVSPCGLHRVAAPRRWPGQRHGWLIRWEAQINLKKHGNLLQRSTIPWHLPLKCNLKVVIIKIKLQTLRKSWNISEWSGCSLTQVKQHLWGSSPPESDGHGRVATVHRRLQPLPNVWWA